MEEEEEGGDFSPIRCSSFRFGRSRSSILFADSIPSESARFTAYHSLSHSMRLSAESDRVDSTSSRKKTKQPWRILSRIFSHRKSNGPDQIIREIKITGDDRSSAGNKKPRWLPDPNRRWPVQVEGDADLRMFFKGNEEHGYLYVGGNDGPTRRGYKGSAACEGRTLSCDHSVLGATSGGNGGLKGNNKETGVKRACATKRGECVGDHLQK